MTVRRGVVLAFVACVAVVLLWWLRRDTPTTADDVRDGVSVADEARTGTGSTRGAAARGGASATSGRRIAGIVVGEDGAPIRGASVRLGGARLPVPAEVRTDDAGRFDFGMRRLGAYSLAAEASGLTATLEELDLRASRPSPDALRVVMYPCAAAIHGTIRDTAGGVIAGASIAQVGASPVSRGADSAADGTYALCVPIGGSYLRLTADGYAARREYANVFGRTRRDFTLAPGTSVSGRVVVADTGAPVADAIVTVRSADSEPSFIELSATSQDDGRFVVDGLAPGRYGITAHADGLATLLPVDVIAEIGAADDTVVEVSKTFALAGNVVERHTGTPLGDARVDLSSSRERTATLRAYTAPDGSFVIDGLVPGDYTPWVDGHTIDEQHQIPIAVADRDVRDVAIVVERLGSISGRVVRGGKPVHGADVSTSGAHAKTDVDGTFTLRGLRAGEHRVYAQSDRAGAFTRGPTVTLANREQRTGVEVELELAASVSGVVVDQTDRPVAGAFVSFSLLRGRDNGSATTADDGTFTARAMSGGGQYVYQVTRGGPGTTVLPPLTGKRHPPIAVADGATHVSGLRVRVRVERRTIRGVVVDGDGAPVPDALVRAEHEMTLPSSTTTDEHGAFTLDDLGTGRHTVFATSTRGEARVENVEAGRADLRIDLVAPGALEGTLEGFAGQVSVVALRTEDDAKRYRANVRGTTFRVAALPPGDYSIVASDEQDSTFSKATVTARTTARLALRRATPGAISGSVVDDRGPVADAWCVAVPTSPAGAFVFERHRHRVRTDAQGTFQIPRVAVGETSVWCSARQRFGETTVVVAEGRATAARVTLQPREPERPRASAGMTVESQLGETLVATVAPSGPAAKAGVAVGDVVLELDGDKLTPWGAQTVTDAIHWGEVGSTVKLVLERDDKTLTVSVTLVAETK